MSAADEKTKQRRLAGNPWETRCAKHPLVGLFLHTFDDAGLVQYQARILAVNDHLVSVQMYSWLSGFGSNKEIFKLDFVNSDKCKLYPDEESWNDEANRLNQCAEFERQKRRAASGSVNEGAQ